MLDTFDISKNMKHIEKIKEFLGEMAKSKWYLIRVYYTLLYFSSSNILI